MKYFFSCLLLMALMCSCGDAEQKNETAVSDSAKVAEDIRSNMSFLNDYKAMEAVFGNENWMMISNKDTSFLYFSRLGDMQFNTYAYKIVKGDSARVDHQNIVKDKNNLAWMFDRKKLIITSATSARVVGQAEGTDSARYEFTRMDADHLSITYPGQKKMVLQKTLPFGLFLVRSRYDYANGTKLAFDTTQFRKKH